MIRKAVPGDIDIIVELGIESMEVNAQYPELLVSESRIRELMRELVSGSSHFVWVDEIGGRVVGVVCGMVHDIMFYERKQLSVVMLYCREPGGGGFLVRKMMKWFRSRPALKACVFSVENGLDDKIGEFLIKMGLQRKLPTYIGVK